RDMSIVRSPRAVGGAPRARRSAIPLGLENNLDTATALGIVTVDNTFPDTFRDARCAGFFHIGHKGNTFQCAQKLNRPFFDIILIQTVGLNGSVVEVYL